MNEKFVQETAMNTYEKLQKHEKACIACQD